MGLCRIAFAILIFSPPITVLASDPVDITRPMHRAAAQLVVSQRVDGLFRYDIDLRSGQSTPDAELGGMALVRQSGAALALSRYNGLMHDAAIRKAIRVALQAMAERSLPIGKGNVQRFLENLGLLNRWRLWQFQRAPMQWLGWLYESEGTGSIVAPNDRYEQTYTGATALALATGLHYRAESGDTGFDGWLKRWAHGLVALHVHGRGVRESAAHLTESDYVNAQSWLALILYNGRFPQDTVAAEALPELEAYIRERYRSYRPRFFHWGNMAALERAMLSNDAQWLEFMRISTRQLLSEKRRRLDSTDNNCHLLEGLASYLLVESRQGESGNELASLALTALGSALRRNLFLQVDKKIGLKISQPIDSTAVKAWDGAFFWSIDEPVARVDLTAHCLNAMVYLHELLAESGDRLLI